MCGVVDAPAGIRMSDARAVVSGLFCLFFAGIVAAALGWSRDTGLAPLLVGGPGLVLSLLQLRDDIRNSRRAPMRIPPAALRLLAAFLGFVLVTLAIGLLPGAFVCIAVFLRVYEHTGYGFALAMAAAYTGIAWLLFDIVLELTLFGGILFT